ncbi:MAG: M42 family metallopeptidase [Clostridia bacterium]|nr:M42 family metallopeptidase [Clostridia bacterium]
MIDLLKKLTQTDGVSGDEGDIRAVIEKEIKKYCDEISTDAMGNLIAHKKGNGKRVMLAAHMDEIGIIVTFIDDLGFIRFGAVGGLDVKDLVGRRVRFKDGTIGVIGSEDEEFSKKADINKLYIDIGISDTKKIPVQIGDRAAFVGDYTENKTSIISKALDNRVGCYILISALKKIKKNKNDLYFVFTAQEEVGLRGAKTSAYSVNPEYAIAVDVTDTGDTPSAPKMAVKMGNGAAIKVMDRSILCDSTVRNLMCEVSKKNKIPYQLEIMTDGGTDAGAIHLTRAGVKTGGISVPSRYIHSPSEMVAKSDVEACVELAINLVDSF